MKQTGQVVSGALSVGVFMPKCLLLQGDDCFVLGRGA